MSRYQIREALVSLGDDFDIKDGNGQPVFHVDGKIFTIRNSAKITDMAGAEVAGLHRKMVAIRHTFVIERPGQKDVRVRKDLINIIGDHFVIERDDDEGGQLDVRGDILHHSYRIEDKKGMVAEVSKAWISLTHTYGVEIESGQDDLLIPASVVAIDVIYHRENEQAAAAAIAASQAKGDKADKDD